MYAISLLLFLIILAILGEPLRHYLFKQSVLLKNLNLLQVVLLDFYLGGAILYIIALFPFRLFTLYIAWGMLTLGVGSTIYIHRGSFMARICKIANMFKSRKNIFICFKKMMNYRVLEGFLVLSMFLCIFTIHFSVQTNFIFGSIDYAWHSLIAQKILENARLTLTLKPYVLDVGMLNYPQGFHVLPVYAHYIFGWSLPEAVTYLTIMFQALPILGGYFFGKMLEKNEIKHLGLAFAFIFGFVSRWPKLITWGSNAFILGFTLFLILLSFIPHTFEKKVKMSMRDILLLSCLLGYLCAIHPAYYIIIILCYVILVLLKRDFSKISTLLAIFGVSLPIIAYPLVFSVVYDIFNPPDIPVKLQEIYPGSVAQLYSDWHCWNKGDWISFSPFLRHTIKFLIPVSVFYFIISKRKKFMEVLHLSFSVIVSGILIIGVNLMCWFFKLPIILKIPYQEFEFLIYDSLLLFVGLIFANIFSEIRKMILINRKNISATLLIIISISLFLYPFIYYSTFGEIQYLKEQYEALTIVSENDYALMLWIKENTPENSTILVGHYEGGIYIPVLSNRKTVFIPNPPVSYCEEYMKINEIVGSQIYDPQLLELLRKFNFTHVFVGEKVFVAPGLKPFEFRDWEPTFFLNNPNFKLVKCIGGSYLFEITYLDPYAVFYESWEDLDQWRILKYGSGYYNLTVIPSDDANKLQISIKKIEGTRCSIVIDRPIGTFKTESYDILLSFDIQLENFNPKDYVIIFIYDEDWTRRIAITTPNPGGGALKENEAFEILNSSGRYSINISELWYRVYGSNLPRKFILQIIVGDVDGITNTLTINNLMIRLSERE